VTISRAAGSMTFPAEFMLVAAMNPCPCGHAGNPKRECRCSSRQIQQYRQRISGPLLDRIDIHVEVPAVEYKELSGQEAGESSQAIRERVENARAVQGRRFAKSKSACNARMSSKEIRAHCTPDDAGQEMLKMAVTELNFSARAYDRILKVARTIADLEGSERVQFQHISEAIQYRTLDRNLWA
jgi:magnesium chelatase family protein